MIKLLVLAFLLSSFLAYRLADVVCVVCILSFQRRQAIVYFGMPEVNKTDIDRELQVVS